MPIQVLCPKCRSRFQVSEKFAGQSGPCPKCKATIRVPKPSEEVKIHGPEEFASGGRGASGQLITKPIAHTDVKLQPTTVAIIAAIAVTALAVAWLGGRLFASNLVARVVGLLAVTPPIVLAGYFFLRDDELEPYRGRALWIRAGICSLAYVLVWWLYAYLAGVFITGELWNWLVVLPPVFVLGALSALATLDIDFGSGIFHFFFYVLVTVLLRWAAGMGWIWDVVPPP